MADRKDSVRVVIETGIKSGLIEVTVAAPRDDRAAGVAFLEKLLPALHLIQESSSKR
jgi:hypothetical protein